MKHQKVIWTLFPIIIIIFLNTLFMQKVVSTNSYPSYFQGLTQIKLPLEKYFVLDSIGLIIGFRKLISDIAWIQLLQYYGGEAPEDVEKGNKSRYDRPHHNHLEQMTKIQPGKYKRFLDYCRRITILDPLYSFVYFYGVGCLAWNLERPDEALKYSEEGLKNLKFQKDIQNSDYWELVKYQQAIVYKIGGRHKEMISKLKEIVESGKAPNLVKAILANLYKKYGFYKEALNIWYDISLSGDPEYIERAKYQIQILKNLLKNRGN